MAETSSTKSPRPVRDVGSRPGPRVILESILSSTVQSTWCGGGGSGRRVHQGLNSDTADEKAGNAILQQAKLERLRLSMPLSRHV